MALSPTEDTKLGAQALAYVIELYRELTVENGAPTLGKLASIALSLLLSVVVIVRLCFRSPQSASVISSSTD